VHVKLWIFVKVEMSRIGNLEEALGLTFTFSKSFMGLSLCTWKKKKHGKIKFKIAN